MIFFNRIRVPDKKTPSRGIIIEPVQERKLNKLNFEVHLIALDVSVRHRRGILGGSVFGTLDDDIDAAPGFGSPLANLLPLLFLSYILPS